MKCYQSFFPLSPKKEHVTRRAYGNAVRDDIFAMDMQGIAASSRRNLHNFGACGKACCTGFKGKKPVASQGLQTPDEYGSQLMAKFGDKKAGGRKVGGRKR
eukprot:gnl/MRDRNA2_/MRDRNA2_27368_c0_seq1.p1 gnl/MRDRNA2_/MRDRNA2_27368_c0~~gnl/MRDRNA2_/MRDRNA2_27368_c0_seq1.p1  ORF type:complete len:101 (+),score=19.63 gnl/MRDRNA2_/MRDRNA2_27368_c0_seq1:60-362(+)